MASKNPSRTSHSLDWLIKIKVDSGWYLDENGQLCRPSGKVHQKTSKGHAGHRYHYINFGHEGKVYQVMYARLICWLKWGPPKRGCETVDHIDRDSLNDHPDNLRWLSRSDNAKNISPEQKEARIKHMKNMVSTRMESGIGFKLSYDKADEIRRKCWLENRSIVSLADEYGVGRETISKVVHHISWVHEETVDYRNSFLAPAA